MKYNKLLNIILTNFITLQIQKQSPIGVLQKMCSANMQQIYRRTPMRKCDFRNVANQLYWNHTSAGVFTCKFAVYLQNRCFDEYLWGTTSANFYSTCLPYFSIQIHLKFGLFSVIFLTRSMFSWEIAVLRLPGFYVFFPMERYFVTFCWIMFFQSGAWLNRCPNAALTAM